MELHDPVKPLPGSPVVLICGDLNALLCDFSCLWRKPGPQNSNREELGQVCTVIKSDGDGALPRWQEPSRVPWVS